MSLARNMLLGSRYKLEQRIGAGGFSEVWRGQDILLGRPVAIKLLEPGHAPPEETLARFRAEARHAGRLSHGNIARVYDYGDQDRAYPPFLVMEFVDGPSLAGLLAGGPMSPGRCLNIVAQTAAALGAAHAAGLVHRDIKPGNLLIGPRCCVKITDFGISRVVDSGSVTRTGALLGTPAYLAPERVAGAQATPASDLYALGIVAYECLVGAPPFTGSALEVAMAHRDRQVPPLPPSVPADVAALVMALTAKNPAARPQSASEVAWRAAELAGARVVGGGVQPAHAVYGEAAIAAGWPTVYLGKAPEPWRGARRPGRLPGHRVAVAAVAAVALIVALVTGLVTSSMIGPEPAHRPAAQPSSSPSRPQSSGGVLTVKVTRDSLLGEPVAKVAQRLRHRGLVVRVRWQRSDSQPSGSVVSVLPVGHRPVGSLVTVTGAIQPPPPPPSPDGAVSQGSGTPHHPGHGGGPPKARHGPGHGRPKHGGHGHGGHGRGGHGRPPLPKGGHYGHGPPGGHGGHHKPGGQNDNVTLTV